MKHEDTDHSDQDHAHCFSCGCEIASHEKVCGECMCEDDGECY